MLGGLIRVCFLGLHVTLSYDLQYYLLFVFSKTHLAFKMYNEKKSPSLVRFAGVNIINSMVLMRAFYYGLFQRLHVTYLTSNQWSKAFASLVLALY